jgi:16S rRNA G1207 methylase RsmC
VILAKYKKIKNEKQTNKKTNKQKTNKTKTKQQPGVLSMNKVGIGPTLFMDNTPNAHFVHG